MPTAIPPEFSGTDARVRSVVTFMDEILDAIVSFYEQESIPLPAKKYWAISTVAADCEQLTVTLLQTYIGLPGGEGSIPAQCDGPRTAVIGLQILRKVPVVGPTGQNIPQGSAIQSMSAGPAIDAWALIDVFKQVDIYKSGVALAIDTVQPEGGLHGVIATLAIQIP